MKELLILRHAKSSWANDDLKDHDRPLNDRGKRDAPRMGQLLKEEDLIPDRVITSDAKRAQKTANLVVMASGFSGKVDVRADYYLADPMTYIEAVNAVGEDAHRVLIIGHNPGMSVLVASLTHHHEDLPTCAMAHIVFPIVRWSELQLTTPGVLKCIWRPRELPAAG